MPPCRMPKGWSMTERAVSCVYFWNKNTAWRA
jgi:hypothetical protein